MELAQTLLLWFKENGRALPWRETHDPYAIWLSEVILQQTRIAQGKAYWEKFMKTWPTVQDLAKASEDEVLKAWQGLGYYSRARNLHKAAQQIMELGRFPSHYKELKQLKGVGDYTAAAIASIAFGEPIAVVDGNVYRVLSRYFGIDTPIDSTQGKKEFSALAQELIAKDKAEAYNQAIMDLGAIQCTPTAPLCASCPLIDSCVAYNQQTIDNLPVKAKKIKQRQRVFNYVYIRCKDRVAIRQRGSGDIWQGLWELPQMSLFSTEITKDSETNSLPLQSNSLANMAISPSLPEGIIEICHDVKHVLTHQIIYANLYLWLVDKKPQLPKDYLWVKEKELNKYAWPRLLEILLEKIDR